MKLLKYNIALQRLGESELELVRNWRNSNHVLPYMHYKKIITQEEQKIWFNALDVSRNFYFLIVAGEKKIGVANLKDIDWNLRNAEAGIFIGDQNYSNTMIPFLATIALMELAFDVLELITLKAKIGGSNKRVILFNESLGYEKVNEKQITDFNYYCVNKEQFYSATKYIRSTLEKLNGDGYELILNPSEVELFKKNNCNLKLETLKINLET